jgi:hypothetical protein
MPDAENRDGIYRRGARFASEFSIRAFEAEGKAFGSVQRA